MSDTLIDTHRHVLGDLYVEPIAVGCAGWSSACTPVSTLEALIDVGRGDGTLVVDTADIYGTTGDIGDAERLLGSVLASSGERREHVVVATKAGVVPPGRAYDSSTRHLVSACEGSLRRLGVDTIDLFQVHRPDVFTHPEEVALALSQLVEQGKVRRLGVSNYSSTQVTALAHHLPGRLVSTSPELSLMAREPLYDGTLDQARILGLTVLPWSPLGAGSLAREAGPPPVLLAELDRLADREGTARGAVALAFLLALPVPVVPIVGTTSPRRLTELRSAGDVSLDRVDLYGLLQAAQGEPLT